MTLRILFSGILFLAFSWAKGQSNRLFLAGGNGNERFHTVFQLSDSTVLVAGEAAGLNWLPAGTPIVTLDTVAGQAPSSVSPTSMGFILHLSKDMGTVLRAFRLPPNTLESINRIKTTSRPGQATGEIYFSGRRGPERGYFVGRLDNNFVNGLPTKVEMGINISSNVVSTGSKHQYDGPSYHRIFQPWDVDGDGHVLAATGEEFEFDWSSIDKFRRNGRPDSVEFFTRQMAWLDGGTQYPWVTGRGVEFQFVTASQLAANLPDSAWVRVIDNPGAEPDVFDSVKIGGYLGANIVLKTYRQAGMRSQNQTEFDLLQNDENGNPGRKSARTDDFCFNAVCAQGQGNCPTNGPGYTGYSLADIWNARVGDIALDRRNGDMYVTYTIPTNGPTVQSSPRGKATNYDMQPVLVAFEKNGRIKWWARLMKEGFGGNPADQLTDGLAIDYASNTVVILGHVFDTCTYNFWKGNELLLNPGGKGFQNQHTGPDPKIEYSWLAKYDLTSGQIRYATYMGENAKNSITGSPLSDPIYHNWPDPNSGNPRLAETMPSLGGRTLDVDGTGNVYVLASTKGRPITTVNAFQKMLKPDLSSGDIDSLPPGEISMVRIYNPTLSGLVYSSVIGGIWNPQDSSARSPITLTGVAPTGSGFYVVGNHEGRLIPFTAMPAPTLNAPSWANDSMVQISGLAGRILFNSPGLVARPLFINGPASHCPGETKTYSVTADPNATQGYQWVMPGANWTIVGPANGPSVQVKFTENQGGQMRVVARNNNGVSEPAYLNIPNTTNPPVVSTAGFVCATGGTATLTALGGGPGNFRWYTDSTSNFPLANEVNGILEVSNITQTTRFFVSIIGGNGCETERRGVNARFGKFAPAINLLPANGPPYTALQAIPPVTVPGVTRAWKKDNVQLATSSVLPLSGPGTYSLCFTNACGDSCVTYVVTSVSGLESGKTTFLVYPNPTNGKFTLAASGAIQGAVQLEVRDYLGRVLEEKSLTPASEDETWTLSLASYPKGLYWIALQTRSGREMIRVVKE